MKVKILLMPLIIAISAGLCVWLVYPAYSNGSNGVKEKYEKMKKEEKKLNDIKIKNQNVEKLFSEMNSLETDKNILYSFLPEKMEQEEIINSIGRIASEFGLLVNEVSLKSTTPELRNKALSIEQLEMETALPLSRESKVAIKFVGKYEKIKDFLKKIYESDRYNNLKLLQIDNNIKENKGSSDGMLVANMEIDFSILAKTKISDGNINDSVFSRDSLDTSIIELIKRQKKISNNIINIDQKGKTNLFIP